LIVVVVIVAPIDVIIAPIGVFNGVILRVGGVTIVGAASPSGFLLGRDLLLR
jgi:hypothetical protein